MKKAIVVGITGQDGSYMADLLLANGYRVAGTTRSGQGERARWRQGEIDLFRWDLRDESALHRIVADFGPDEIYNLAAYSSGAAMFDHPVAMGDINGLAATRILSCIEASGAPIRFCQASSSEVFGDAAMTPQTEATPPNPRTPYGSAKLYADSTVRAFRRHRALHASAAILFNHESPRRGPAFVTSKVAAAAARISAGIQATLALGDLQARRDWGHARDYVEAMWMMLQQTEPDDYVIATGATHSVAELCDVAFSCVGLDYRQHVTSEARERRPVETIQLVGDATKARERLGWTPKISFVALIEEMVMAEISKLKT